MEGGLLSLRGVVDVDFVFVVEVVFVGAVEVWVGLGGEGIGGFFGWFGWV